jgi:hypothetical protein
MIRDAILQLQQLGPLPLYSDLDGMEFDTGMYLLEQYGVLLKAIVRPVTNDEARILVTLFPRGEDDCYEMAWPLLHLIETAPGWPLEDCLQDETNDWIKRLNLRIENARRWGRL